MAAKAEPTYSTSFIASVASVVACSTSPAGPPGSRNESIAASASRRADAEVELRPSRAAGEEEHASELDRRRRDRGGVAAPVHDLGERLDRVRRAGTGARLSELE